MSKTFKSVIGTSDSRRVHIESRPEGPNVWISDNSWGDGYGITLAPSDIPAIMLALAEAAGLTVAKDDFKEGSVEDLLIDAALHLKCAIRLQERITAEAEAQEKLEAEALELFNARQEAIHSVDWEPYKDFANEDSKQTWLAVARRAREINKEDNNA